MLQTIVSANTGILDAILTEVHGLSATNADALLSLQTVLLTLQAMFPKLDDLKTTLAAMQSEQVKQGKELAKQGEVHTKQGHPYRDTRPLLSKSSTVGPPHSFLKNVLPLHHQPLVIQRDSKGRQQSVGT